MLDEAGMKASVSWFRGIRGPAVVKAVKKDQAGLVVMPGPGRIMRALWTTFLARTGRQPQLGPTTMQKIVELRDELSLDGLVSVTLSSIVWRDHGSSTPTR
jgi:hypothetical protein